MGGKSKRESKTINNICVWSPRERGREKRKWSKAMFEEIMAESISKLIKPQILESLTYSTKEVIYQLSKDKFVKCKHIFANIICRTEVISLHRIIVGSNVVTYIVISTIFLMIILNSFIY